MYVDQTKLAAFLLVNRMQILRVLCVFMKLPEGLYEQNITPVLSKSDVLFWF